MIEYKQLIKGNRTLMYKLSYKNNCKNIVAKVDKQNNVIVSAPRFVNLQQIDAFVLKHFDKFYEFIETRKEKSLFNLEENKISLQGKKYEIKIILDENKREKYEIIGNVIYLFLKSIDNKKKIISKMLTQLGSEYLIKRTFYLAKKFNQKLTSVETKWYESKWGQCEHIKRKITLAIQLFMFNDVIIDYVIVHELCHLIYPNHSPKFWSLVGRICPNYKIIKEKLKFEC